jgi:hypothetical protein
MKEGRKETGEKTRENESKNWASLSQNVFVEK